MEKITDISYNGAGGWCSILHGKNKQTNKTYLRQGKLW